MVMPPLTIRRATVDDLPALLDLWAAARLPGDELKDRLTEFQIVETDGRFAGAIGFQVLRQHARLHSEDYVDFSLADTARDLAGLAGWLGRHRQDTRRQPFRPACADAEAAARVLEMCGEARTLVGQEQLAENQLSRGK